MPGKRSCQIYTILVIIYNQINDKTILDKETSDGVWLLNAGINIEHGAKLVIDDGDTKWLKMSAGETSSNTGDDGSNGTSDNGDEGDGSVHAIRVHGSLNIDSVKITSWDPAVNGYIRFESDILPGREDEHTDIDAIPRP
jgi:mannuronan 5-epimerase